MSLFLKRALLTLLLISLQKAYATQGYMSLYEANPYHKAKYDSCALCHTSSAGGGSRNSFGEYFASHGYKFSNSVMNAFPQYFSIPEGGFIGSVQWDINSPTMTPTTNGELLVSLSAKPTNLVEGSALGFKIQASASVLKYLSFSSSTGSVAFDSQGSAVPVSISLIPGAKLSKPATLNKLAKKPLTLSFFVVPFDNDGTTPMTSKKAKVTIEVNHD